MNDETAVRELLRQWEHRLRDTLAELQAIEDGSTAAMEREIITDQAELQRRQKARDEGSQNRRAQLHLLDSDSENQPGLLQCVAAIRVALDGGEHWTAMRLFADLGYRTGRADAWQDWRLKIEAKLDADRDLATVRKGPRHRGPKVPDPEFLTVWNEERSGHSVMKFDPMAKRVSERLGIDHSTAKRQAGRLNLE